jgi:hypothetical protein
MGAIGRVLDPSAATWVEVRVPVPFPRELPDIWTALPCPSGLPDIWTMLRCASGLPDIWTMAACAAGEAVEFRIEPADFCGLGSWEWRARSLHDS